MYQHAFVIKLAVQWILNILGSIQKPYLTYRKLIFQDPLQLLFVFACIGIYFFWVSPIQLRTFHPFLLTINATRLFTVTLVTYLAICFLLLFLGRLFGGNGSLNGVLLNWGYSLIPTLLWFLVTSLFYVVLPPPRHETFLGQVFSTVFITFSLVLLLWKGMLYYLTMRFALRLELKQIMGVSLIFFPVLIVFSFLSYYFGVFRVPFV